MILELSPRPVALYDASVLYPSLIRNLLMYLGTETLVAVRWTDMIHDEWTRNLRLAQPDLTLERLAHIRGLMERVLPDAAVSGFESLIPALTLPDPQDRLGRPPHRRRLDRDPEPEAFSSTGARGARCGGPNTGRAAVPFAGL